MKKKNRATMRFLQEVNETVTKTEPETSEECKKCMKRKQEEDLNSMILLPKRYCELRGNVWERSTNHNKKKKSKKNNKPDIGINSITKSLDKICKITDSLQ